LSARALIAEDEPLLAASMMSLLGAVWPDLELIGPATNGEAAIAMALTHAPDILFLDIRMPGKSGLEVASEVIDDWPDPQRPPLIVFVTAYDEFAIDAFEREAVDFVMKPVVADRLLKTVQRLKARISERQVPGALGDELATLLARVQALSGQHSANPARLDILHLGLGDTVKMVQVEDVLMFEATDKYVRVVAADVDGLIRISMRELMSRVAPGIFIQVHRSIVVRRNAVIAAKRDEMGHMTLEVRGVDHPVPVSRAFTHMFRPM
jgi:DNA-binding LytR/AlgR family response regulator